MLIRPTRGPWPQAATLVTYPLQVVQVTLRAQPDSTPSAASAVRRNGDGSDGSDDAIQALRTARAKPVPRYKGTLDCMYSIHRSRGLSGLYKGMCASCPSLSCGAGPARFVAIGSMADSKHRLPCQVMAQQAHCLRNSCIVQV